MTKVADEKVLVLDFGSQYAQLIARRVRQQQVFCEIVRHDITAGRIGELAPLGIILSGGPSSVYEPGAPKCDPAIFQLGIPVLGICYGMQLACEALGGRVEERLRPGNTAGAQCRRTAPTRTICWPAAAGDPGVDEPRRPGDGGFRRFPPLAATETCPFAAVKHRRLPIYGLQFHPEVTHTPLGATILGNFLRAACHCEGPGSWAISPARASRPFAAAWARAG